MKMTPQQFANNQVAGFVTEKTVDLSYRVAQSCNGRANNSKSCKSLHNQQDYFQQVMQMLTNPTAPSKRSAHVKADWQTVIGNLIQFVQSKINDCQYWLRSNTSINPSNVDYQAKLAIFQSFKTQLSYLKSLK